MKLNWGTGIAIFYTIFVVSLVMQVFKSRQYDHSLVVDNYYEEDIKYQSHYDKLKNTQQLDKNLDFQYDSKAGELSIQFPKEGAEGTILLFRPSSSKYDQLVTISLEEGNIQHIPTNQLAKGLWRVKVNWQAEGLDYYHEDSVVL